MNEKQTLISAVWQAVEVLFWISTGEDTGYYSPQPKATVLPQLEAFSNQAIANMDYTIDAAKKQVVFH